MNQILKKIITSILTLEARVLLSRFSPKIIVVTGSVGKTSAKEAAAGALSSLGEVRKSEKSFNSEIGVPLTILGLQNAWSNPFLWIKNIFQGLFSLFEREYPKWLVLEVGADKPGDLDFIFGWLRPEGVIVTRIPDIPVHVEFYSSPEAVFEEETRPIYSLKDGGVLVLNNDDERVRNLSKESREKVILYGMTPSADVVGKRDEIVYEVQKRAKKPVGIKFVLSYKNEEEEIFVPGVLGMQHVYPVLAGSAAAIFFGASLKIIAEKFKKYEPPPGRMRLIPGIKNTLLVDDSYNSSPAAAKEALRALKSLKCAGRRIVMLGDMLELGKYSTEEHKKIGMEAAKVSDILVTVGVRARFIAEGALNSGMDEAHIYQFDDSYEAGNFIEPLLKANDIVLIKGSQSIRMERVTLELMREPQKAEKLLVRQDEEWRRR